MGRDEESDDSGGMLTQSINIHAQKRSRAATAKSAGMKSGKANGLSGSGESRASGALAKTGMG